MKLNRVQAFGFHLLGSAVAALFSAALVFLVWYRWPLSVATGVTKIFLLLLAVDVVLGPCMTLIVFNPVKKELKRDVAVILLVQICALLYGMYAVFAGRPVYTVYNIDRFTLVSAADLLPEDLKKAGDHALPVTGPQIVGARLPDDAKERDRMLTSSLRGGPDLAQMPQYYLPYPAVASDVKAKMQSFDELMKRQPKEKVAEAQALIDRSVSQNGLHREDVGFVPLGAKAQDLTVVVRRSDAGIVAILPIAPWSQ